MFKKILLFKVRRSTERTKSHFTAEFNILYNKTDESRYAIKSVGGIDNPEVQQIKQRFEIFC